eukprot:TRINITY_DN3738_c6_g1_i2.p1 TRINITY_DN3738_c6_g1~~TRINITY_DN3738_c6_g1_i2.p1  ORF type:complete len:603 (+),score=111.05 TRINITY_DN3738_c6_g1_i2:118-1809(+)
MAGSAVEKQSKGQPQFTNSTFGIEDLEPTPSDAACRTWDWKVFAAAWCIMVANPGAITCGAALLSLGLSPLEATVSHFIGGVILMFALQLQAWPGVKYGIPFPVLARSSFGVAGAHFCTLSRGAVAIMWLAWQMWQATMGLCIAIDRIWGSSVSDWGRMDEYISAFKLLVFLALTLLHAVVIWMGIDKFRILVSIITPLSVLGFVAIAIWASTLATFEEAMSATRVDVSRPHNSHVLAWIIGITSSVATWSTLVLNVCDLSRYCPTQKDQLIAQAVGVPIPFVLTGFIGIWVAGATNHAFGVAMWQVPQYFEKFSPLVAGISAIILAGSLLTVNILANIISPINDLMNLAPKTKMLSFRACGMACLFLGFLVCPWWVFSDESGFVLTYLNGYAVITGAIAGVLICDFWIVRRGELDLKKLYRAQSGCCSNRVSGTNWRAVVAVAAAVMPCLPGFIQSLPGVDLDIGYFLSFIYSASWFFAFFIAGLLYKLFSLEVEDTPFYLPKHKARRTTKGGASPVSPGARAVELDETSEASQGHDEQAEAEAADDTDCAQAHAAAGIASV